MTEFEWRRQLRNLQADSEPPARIWKELRSRIEVEGSARVPARAGTTGKQRRQLPWPAVAAAAIVVVTFAIALFAPFSASVSTDLDELALAGSRDNRIPADSHSERLIAELARNPVLAATDAELRELEEEIERALALQPDSSKLRRMLMRAEGERRRLLQYQSQLG